MEFKIKTDKMNFNNYLQDLVCGTHIIPTTEFLMGSDMWTKEQLDAYQLEKIKSLISFSYKHVKYYHELFKKISLKPEDIKQLSDITKIPILTKEIVRKEYNNLIADQAYMRNHPVKKAKTGGTTGTPLVFYKNRQTKNFTWGAYTRWYNWMGVKENDRNVSLWGTPTVLSTSITQKLKSEITNRLSNSLVINSFKLNDKTLSIISEQIIKFKPLILRGYLSAILQMAHFFEKNDLRLPSLKVIHTTTETLLPPIREYIEQVFNVKIFDQYGCGECNSIAFECNSHNGLHINEEHCYLEILDESENTIINKDGRIIITDLDNYAFPFIRFENGDSAVLSSKKCNCGRQSRLIKYISGRTKDVIYLKDGSAVHGVFFTDLFHELGYDNFRYFTRFQIYQKEKGSFICRLEKTNEKITIQHLEIIQNNLNKFGKRVTIEIIDKLQNDTSGKFRYVISEIKEDKI